MKVVNILDVKIDGTKVSYVSHVKFYDRGMGKTNCKLHANDFAKYIKDELSLGNIVMSQDARVTKLIDMIDIVVTQTKEVNDYVEATFMTI